MKRIMRKLELLSQEDIVQLKGKIASVLMAGDELLLTELIVNGFFNDLPPAQVAAVLTCMVLDENSSKEEKSAIKKEELKKLYDVVKSQAHKMAGIYTDCKLKIDKVKQPIQWTLSFSFVILLKCFNVLNEKHIHFRE